MSMMTDHYKYAGPQPTEYSNLKDDVSAILEHCRDLDYDTYSYGGLVLQIQPVIYAYPPARYFISFTMTNDGRQRFHEASGNGIVINSHTSDSPLEDFLDLMKRSVTPDMEA